MNLFHRVLDVRAPLALGLLFSLTGCDGPAATDGGLADTSVPDGGAHDAAVDAPASPAVRACEEAADAYLALCAAMETDPGRRCEIETYRTFCADGNAAAVQGAYECLTANRMAGGVCATFSDLATPENRACVTSAVGTLRPSAAAAQAAYCALCTESSVCLVPSTASPPAWDYFSDAINGALETCFAAATTCDAASACVAETPLAACF